MSTDPTTQRTVSGAEGPPPSTPLGPPKPVARPAAALCEATEHGREGEPEPCGRERPCPAQDTGVPELIAELGHWGANQPDRPPRGAPPAAVPNPPPTGPAILGRALLDGQGNAWPANDREWAESERGPVREVLLVDPAVARALAELRRWVRDWEAGSEPDDQALVAAAVDALPDAGTDTPTTTGEASAQVTPANGGDTGADTTPEDELADGQRAIYDHVVGAPPAGGAGWDRDTIAMARAELHQFPSMQAALDALLADWDAADSDRDALERSLMRRRQQLRAVHADADRLRDELAERTRERDYSDAALEAAARDMAQTTTDRDRPAAPRLWLEAERERHRAELAEVRAELEYVRADREGLDLQRNRLLAERIGTRQRAAADALEEAANDASVLLESGARAFTARGLRARADIIRADGRPVPGSPQPAPAGGEEPDHGE
jgi:hypothetical protein